MDTVTDDKSMSKEGIKTAISPPIESLKEEFDRKYEANDVSESSEKLKEYKFMSLLGKGAFGLVKLVKHEPADKFYAVKIQTKEKIVRSNQVKHVLNEKRILRSIEFPFLVNLTFSFKDNSYLYFGMEFINGGEMFTHLRKMKKFPEVIARFYAAQVTLGFEYIHKMGMIYRDLKPENILIDYRGFLKITDFGFCKKINDRTYTLCGTPEYIAPEIIQNKGYGKSADWWSYGILLFEMSAGYSPFAADNPDQMELLERIVEGKFRMSSSIGPELKDLIEHMLQTDLSKRFGNLKNGINDIKNHPWFKSINWNSLYNRQMEPPFVPKVSGPGDFSQFDKYEEIPLKVSDDDNYEKEFADF